MKQSIFLPCLGVFLSVLSSQTMICIDAFTIPTQYHHLSTSSSTSTSSTSASASSTSTTTHQIIPHSKKSFALFESTGYIPPEKSDAFKDKRKAPPPKVGDVVRYYDLDGGRVDGQELIGKITWIQSQTQPQSSSSTSSSKWIAEITEMEDVGDGYYTEYSSRKRRKSKLYNIADLSPLPASYVRTEDAFKIPLTLDGKPMPSWENYNLEDYDGPGSIPVNEEVVQNDLDRYGQLKNKLLKDAAIAGLIGTVIAQITRGLDDALIYLAGAIAGLGYLFFLSIKTDTLGSNDAKLGSNVSNLRFGLPLLVLVGVSIQNLIAGDASPVLADGGTMTIFRSVSPEQFGAAMLGFLTYRIPLFLSQLTPILSESAELVLPGSAGVAMQMANDAKNAKNDKVKKKSSMFGANLTTILLISGPEGTGKSKLVSKLIENSQGKLVSPTRVDIIAEPILYEQLLAKNAILQIDESGRYALTRDGILSAARKPKDGEDIDQVVVVDADVNLSKKLVNLGGTRLVGVWIGLDELEKFESNLREELDSGAITIPEDETKESVLRAKIRAIVKDIEYGVVSGIFEFTVLNDDFDKSLLQLKDAADYCFE